MSITFFKYQGTGNDFIMIDNRLNYFPKTNVDLVKFLCDRKFGIGADGLILLENDVKTDFRMVYFNANGIEGSMCGNGGRCIVAFAKFLDVVSDECTFVAVDGLHFATIKNEIVSLQMSNVDGIKEKENTIFMDTGSPHHVQTVNDLSNFDVFKEGKKLRYGLYGASGSNINFVEQLENGFAVRTYERGVEDETLSCGTGATAVALAMHKTGKTALTKVPVKVEGGVLEISFEAAASGYKNIFLTGSAQQVFKGEIKI